MARTANVSAVGCESMLSRFIVVATDWTADRLRMGRMELQHLDDLRDVAADRASVSSFIRAPRTTDIVSSNTSLAIYLVSVDGCARGLFAP